MTIQTEYYGTVEFQESDLITFPDGLFGFHHLTRYLPMCFEEGDDSVLMLVSVEEPTTAFALVNPLFLCPGYSPELTYEELACLGVTSSEQLSYYVICTIQPDYLDNTVNLKCPLAINPDTNQGIQVILENSAYSYRHELRSFSAVIPANQDGILPREEAVC